MIFLTNSLEQYSWKFINKDIIAYSCTNINCNQSEDKTFYLSVNFNNFSSNTVILNVVNQLLVQLDQNKYYWKLNFDITFST